MGLFSQRINDPRLLIYDYFKRAMIYFNDPTYWWNKSVGINGQRRVISTSMREQDISPTAKTTWGNFADIVPGYRAIKDIQANLGSITGKTVGGIAKYLDVQAWKSTSQLKISFKLHFDTETSPKDDVWNKALALWGYTLPEDKGDGIMKVPGVNLIEAIKQSTAKKDAGGGNINDVAGIISGNTNRLVTVQLGGFIYLKNALLTDATPTLSTNTTESGYPLWADIDCTVETLQTADLRLIEEMKDGIKTDSKLLEEFILSTALDRDTISGNL